MSIPRHARKLIPIAMLLLLAISWIPVAVCTAMSGCPMMAAQAVGLEGMADCHATPAPEPDSQDSLRLEAAPCCYLDQQPAQPAQDEIPVTGSTALPVATPTVVARIPVASPEPSQPDRTPAPKIFGRALLSQHQAFLL